MGHGATLAMGGSGVLSNMVRTTVAASGAGTTYHGINEIKQGNTISGTFFSVLGIADMFSAGASQVMASKGLGINKPVMTSESENLAGLYKPSPVSLAEATPIKSGEPRFILNNTGYAFEPNNTNILRGPNGGSIARTGVRYGPWGEVYFENGRYFVPGNNGKRVYIKSDSLNPYKRPEIPEIISQTKHLGKTTPPSVPPSGSAIDASSSQLRVFNGKALHPDLPSPVAGLDYIPKQLNSPNVNIRYSQVNGYLAEIDLANDLAASGRRVLKWGDRIGKHGNDVITVNPKTGTVELWDNKFRSTPAAGEISPTFRNQKTLSAALREARDYIQHSNLPPSLKAKAMDNIDKGSVTVYTTASGEVDFSTMNKVINGILQE
jgi:hypothetical protein